MEGKASVRSTVFSCRIHFCKCALRLKALKDFSKGANVHVGMRASIVISSMFLLWPVVVRHTLLSTCKEEIPFWADFLY